MIYTYFPALIIFLISLYIAEHLYLKDNTKVYHIRIFHLVYFFILFLTPVINIISACTSILFTITKSTSHTEYFYTGIFKPIINKLIIKYNNFLWYEI